MPSGSSITGRSVLVGLVATLLQLQGAAVSHEPRLTVTSAAGANPGSRLPCPPDAKVEEAIELIRAAYEAAYDQAKDGGDPDLLIEQLTGLANQATDPAKKYALLVEAEAIATQYENFASALDLLAKRAEQFQIDGLKVKSQLLRRLAGPKILADQVLFDQAIDTAKQAVQAERFDVAAEAASLAVSVAKAIDREQKAEARKRGRAAGDMGRNESSSKLAGPALVKEATNVQSWVNAAQKLFAEYGEAMARIESQPDDATANASVAKYLCFVRGDWKKGLPALAKSDLEGLADVAANEIALFATEKPDAKQVFGLAGAWWSKSESKSLSADQQSAVRDHAAGFYADVVDGLTDAIEKQLATSRLRGHAERTRRNDKPPVYLSDLPVKRSLVGWDRLRCGRLADVQVNGRVYDKIIKADAPSLVVFDLPDGFEGTIGGGVAIAGLSKDISPPSSCRFRIFGDEKLLWESGVIAQDRSTGLSVMEQFQVTLVGLKTINLEVDSLGANHSDWSVWVNPVLAWKGSRAIDLDPVRVRAGEDKVGRDGLPPGKGDEVFAFNGHTYWFPKERTNQIEAKRAAEKVGGNLVVIDGDEENRFVATHVRGPSWIGIGKSPQGLVKFGGGQATYFSWDRNGGQPSNTAGELGVSTNGAGLWHDHYVSDELFYVVEWPRVLPGAAVRFTNDETNPRTTVFDFTRPNEREKFATNGPVRQRDSGLELTGEGPAWADSLQSFAFPLTATFVAATFPDKNYDCYAGIFASPNGGLSFRQTGIHLHWGCFFNRRSVLYVFGKMIEIRHRPIEAGRDNTLVMRVDSDRQLAIVLNGETIHQEVLPPDLKLEGAIRCGGGIGHVIYRSASVVANQPSDNGAAEPDPGNLMRYRAALGRTQAFRVTGSLDRGPVWGSNPYTADSQLARAAVHAGVLRPGESGVVNVTILPGQPAYPGSARNGVTSAPWGGYDLSYRIEVGAFGGPR